MRLPDKKLRLDLLECVLEDRILMAYGPGLQGMPFLAINPFSNSMIVPGTSLGSNMGGGGSTPGPSFYNLLLGTSLNSSGGLQPTSGGLMSLYTTNIVPTTMLGTGGSMLSGRTSSGGLTGASPGVSRSANTSGYGGSFSGGFGFALNAANNFGMTTATVGSVPVHTYGGGGEAVATTSENPETQQNAMPDMAPGSPQAPGMGVPAGPGQGVDVNPRNNLLGHGRHPAPQPAPGSSVVGQ